MTAPIVLSNRYQLEERQGSGGMAMVFRAQDLMLERTVAIKLLRTDFSRDPDFRERFRQEAKAVANLSHPNIVTVHDFGLDGGRLFIVMEYVPGTDLKTIINQRGRFTEEEAIVLMIQACAGIGYAHRAGLVHCDVKPQNMLVTPDKRLKVVDFGIARALATIAPDEKTDVVWGSPQYFSPEQAAGDPPSPASDVYSLGIVMFEMLTTRLPFQDPAAEELARMHRELPPPSIRKYNPAISSSLEQILLKVLAKEPSNRYRTADQLGRVLVTLTQQAAAATVAQPAKQPSEPTNETILPTAQPVSNNSASLGTAYNNQAKRQLDSQPVLSSASNPLDIDWMTLMLGLFALIAVGGLIPFCLWVYYVLNPPI
jgi:eukaryotic-like serine/threonine-protein kinase